jgi:hypothetical protein
MSPRSLKRAVISETQRRATCNTPQTYPIRPIHPVPLLARRVRRKSHLKQRKVSLVPALNPPPRQLTFTAENVAPNERSEEWSQW